MIDLEYLEKLIALLERSSADTIELRRRGTSIRVSKSSGYGPAPAFPYAVPPPATAPSQLPAAAAGAPAPGDGGGSATVERELVEIKSPMVGTFYAQPEPGAEPYVRPGSRISVGQTLCIIEAMKIMNPLDSEVVGVIVERLVEDAQPVEFGQVLFRVDPHG